MKYYPFRKWKDFPKTHSLKELLKALGKTYKKEKEIKKIIKENELTINNLEQAYITARYLPVEFSEDQVKKFKKWVIGLIKFLKNYEKTLYLH